jgi:hypothetical protein
MEHLLMMRDRGKCSSIITIWINREEEKINVYSTTLSHYLDMRVRIRGNNMRKKKLSSPLFQEFQARQ